MDKDIIRMANDIAVNLAAMGDRDAIAEHINKFWSPDMRMRLFELFDENSWAFNANLVHVIHKVKCLKYNPINAEFKEKGGTGG